jgi:cell division protein FtsI (penicillin-binding protein 3)
MLCGTKGTLMHKVELHIEGVKQGAMEVARTRLMVPVSLLCLGFLLLLGRLISVGLFEPLDMSVHHNKSDNTHMALKRGDIVDRNGVLLATNLASPLLAARPRLIEEAGKVAHELSYIFEDLNETLVTNKLKSGRKYVYLKRSLTPEQVWKVNALGHPGLVLEAAEKRIYPQGELMSHILGYVNHDNKPQAGVEKYFDDQLSSQGKTHEPLILSLDYRVQYILRSELAGAVDKFSAKSGAGIVMDVNTGEIVAMASLPEYNPNLSIDPTSEVMTNHNVQSVYELGSGFKTFTVAMALDSGVVDLRGGYDVSIPLKVSRFEIKDDHPKNRWLTVPEIFSYSSNIGSAMMVKDLGIKQQKKYLRRLGLFERSPIELFEASSPLLPRRWGLTESMTVSYGHGIAVTPIHLVEGISSIINGGYRVSATLLKQEGNNRRNAQRIISEKTSNTMRHLMRLVVEYGTGRKAYVEGYRVGGKTGTAEKVRQGQYDKKNVLASFVGIFPSDEPQYAVFAMLDEPHGTADTFNFTGGGWTAAPLVGRIIERIGPLLNVKTRTGVDVQYEDLILVSAEP